MILARHSNQFIGISTSSGGNRITNGYNDGAPKSLTFFNKNFDTGTNTAVMHMTTNDFLGIGTESPTSRLVVASDNEATSSASADYTTVISSAGKRVQIGATDTFPAIQAVGTGTSGYLLLNPYVGRVGIGTTTNVNGTLALNTTGTTSVTLNRSDVASMKIQCNSTGTYIDTLEDLNLNLRYASGGNTKTAMTISGTTGNVACSKDVTAQAGEVRLTSTGTGENKRGIIQLVPPDTVLSNSNVFYVMEGGKTVCGITAGGQVNASGYDLEALPSLP